MTNVDGFGHTRGDSLFIDDIPLLNGTLFGVPFPAPVAHAKIKKLDFSKAEKLPGVVKVLSARDIPGVNQIGGIFPDEPLFDNHEIHYRCQPLALVIAESEAQARKALSAIVLEYDELTPVIDPREAARLGLLIMPPVTFACGDIESIWSKCDLVVEGSTESGGQEHLYLETQGAIASLTEDGGVTITSSTQGPTAVQRAAAQVLNLPMHKIEVLVHRLGGGFGGKEDQATPWAVMAALGALILKRPVKVVLHRIEDMRMTGKRHPYSSDYKIGLTNQGKILGYEVSFYQNAGAHADLSPAILGRTLFHANNTYFIPNLKATAYSCKTNLLSNTAFRGFGGPQGMFVIEAAICHAARKLGRRPADIQELNLLKDGDSFHYGQSAKACTAGRCWKSCLERYKYAEERERVDRFNRENSVYKKGLAVMPICFGISFTKTQMNQASSLVHVYTDGSVGVTTAAVEMGQGVNTKLVEVVSRILSISPRRVRIQTTSTNKIANTFPSAASAESDLNGNATAIACRQIKQRMLDEAAYVLGESGSSGIELKDEVFYSRLKKRGVSWHEILESAHKRRVNLSAHAHYATPDIHFNLETKKGEPFAYHVYGTALVEVTVDCLHGTLKIDSVQLVHDYGTSIDPITDLGQTEGGLVQGLGWMTLEEVVYNNQGKLLADTFSSYKIPDMNFAPTRLEVHFLENSHNPVGVLGSKAVGEPPLMYGIGAYFAAEEAIRAFRPGVKLKVHAPMTNERILLSLYQSDLD